MSMAMTSLGWYDFSLGDPLRNPKNYLPLYIDKPSLSTLVLVIPSVPADDLEPDPWCSSMLIFLTLGLLPL